MLELSEVARESLDVYAELRRNLTQREQEFQVRTQVGEEGVPLAAGVVRGLGGSWLYLTRPSLPLAGAPRPRAA